MIWRAEGTLDTFACLRAVLGRDCTLSPSERLTLVAVIVSANKKGICWPAVQTLARKTGLATRTVRRATSELQRLGIILVKRDARGRRSNTYALTDVRGLFEQRAPRAPVEQR